MSVLKAFNSHLLEFLDDIIQVFPKDIDLKATRLFLYGMTKAKPNSIIKIWKLHIIGPYKTQIARGNFSFFIEKDYTEDVGAGIEGNKNELLASINQMRIKIRDMEDINKQKSMKYIQNLTKLCNLYFIDKA